MQCVKFFIYLLDHLFHPRCSPAMPREARRGAGRLQFRPGGGAIITAAVSCIGGSLAQVTPASDAGAHLQTTRGYETGPVSVRVDFCK